MWLHVKQRNKATGGHWGPLGGPPEPDDGDSFLWEGDVWPLTSFVWCPLTQDLFIRLSVIPRPPFSLCRRTATKSTQRPDRCVRWKPAGTSHNPQGHYQLTAHNEWLVVYVVSAASLGPWNKPTSETRRCVLNVWGFELWWWVWRQMTAPSFKWFSLCEYAMLVQV